MFEIEQVCGMVIIGIPWSCCLVVLLSDGVTSLLLSSILISAYMTVQKLTKNIV